MALEPTRELVLRADAIEAAAFADLYAAAPGALRERLGLQVREQAGATLLLAPGLPTAMFNRVIGFGQAQPADEASLATVIDTFRSAGGHPWWLHWGPAAAPASFEQGLPAHGFVPPARCSWAKVARDATPAPHIASELTIEPTTEATLADTTAAIATAFGMPPFMPAWLAALHGRPRWRLYTVAEAGRPVGGGCLYLEADAAWLGMGSVLPSHRRRGGQGALMARRIDDALAAGCRWVFTETGEPMGDEPNPSLANMARCGFVTVASRRNHEAPKPAAT